MRVRGLDLNLLQAFDLLLETRSVSGAAGILNLSQPAVSSALSRLRQYFNDDILIADGRTMVPTPFAETLRPLVRDILEKADILINTSSEFDPSTSTRNFRISASDYILTVLLAPMLTEIATTAPGIKFEIVPTGPSAMDLLDQGAIDALIGPEGFMKPRHPSRLLFEEEHVVVGCRTNPLLASVISKPDFLKASHVIVRVGASQQASFAEQHLKEFPDRSVDLVVPNFITVPQVIVGTRRICVLQKRLFEAFSDLYPIVSQPLPVPVPLLREAIQFHHTREKDQGLKWFAAQCLKQIGSEAGSPDLA